MFTTLIKPADLVDPLEDDDWAVFDCRFTLTDPDAGRRAYEKEHIPGARYADLEKDLSAPVTAHSGRHPLPDPGVLARKLGDWGVSDGTQVVVYDDSFGAMAGRMWWLLRWLGHEAVAVLDGGLPRWRREGYAMTNAPPKPSPRRFVPRLRNDLRIDSRGAAAAAEQGVLIDARAEERFAGDVEPLDKVAGHVPGAVNLPFEDNLDVDGSFLPPEELRAVYEDLCRGRPPSAVVHMCGSGVTACHNVLAMEVAGLRGSILYPGSWSEWITDPGRPVATGP
jgi:thiosulfate/3-mercaptopyruvate sulfurtransferase